MRLRVARKVWFSPFPYRRLTCERARARLRGRFLYEHDRFVRRSRARWASHPGLRGGE